MDFQQLLESITPEIYESFKKAVELGKWPDTRPLSAEQKALCMQAIIAYEQTSARRATHRLCAAKNDCLQY